MRPPRIRDRFRTEVVPPDLVFFLSDRGSEVVRSELFAALVPLIDGHRSVGELADEMNGRVTLLDVRYGLEELGRRGLLAGIDSGESHDEPSSAIAVGGGGATLSRRGDGTKVAVVSLGSTPAAALVARLGGQGLAIDGEAPRALALVDDYLSPELERFHRESLARERPWLALKLVGGVVWLGPVFDPPATPCWACLAERIRWNRPVENFLESVSTSKAASRLGHAGPPLREAALRLALPPILDWLATGEAGPLRSHLLTLDPVAISMERHPVQRRPDCPDCGDGAPQPPGSRPLELESRPVVSTDGGYRTVHPEETLARLMPLVSPVTGAVRTLARRGANDAGPVHVYVATPSVPGRLEDWTSLSEVLHLGCAGKGMARSQAQVSALAEAIERSSGMFRGDEVAETASFAALADAAIHPNACLLVSAKQYRERELWNEDARPTTWIPRAFDEERVIEWSRLRSLTEERWKYLPTGLCFYGYPAARDPRFGRADSSGNAAGNTIEEAIVQGFLELVERDAVALWWYNRARRPAIDLDGLGDPNLGRLGEEYRARGRELWLLDLTSDLRIPVVAALSRRKDRERDRPIMGFGAHVSPEIAVARALTELNQFLPNSPGESAAGSLAPPGFDWGWLEPGERSDPPAPPGLPSAATRDLRELVGCCVELLRERGLELLVLDQTRPGLGLVVARVVVPGLRPWWPRFAPGRLYDVPVTLGWIERARSESRLARHCPFR